MKSISIAENIRRLRLREGMTQEALSQRLGVTFQTVSKWENSLTAPDLTMLPALADLFQVSVDELLGYDGKARRAEIDAISKAAYEKRLQGDMEGASHILREGLGRFPGDEVLLNCLLYSTPDPVERIRTATALSETAVLADVRYDALRFLAQDYSAQGNYEMARAAIERIPEFYFTKLTVAAGCLPGEEKRKYAQQQKGVSLEHLVDMMAELARYYDGAGEPRKAKEQRDRAMALIDLFEPEVDWADDLRAELKD